MKISTPPYANGTCGLQTATLMAGCASGARRRWRPGTRSTSARTRWPRSDRSRGPAGVVPPIRRPAISSYPSACSTRRTRRPGAGERPQVGVERVHVLVDPVLELLCLVRSPAGAVDGARPLVQRDDAPAVARHARHLADHAAEVEGVVQRGDAVRDVERLVRERKALAVGLDPEERPDLLLVEGAAPQPDVRVGEDVGAHVGAAGRDDVGCAPALRRTHLQNAHSGLEQIEEQPERVLVRLPREVFPAEIAGQVGQRGVDGVVGLVPALGAGHRRPAIDLPSLGGNAGDGLVEETRDAVGHRERPAAAAAAQLVPICDVRRERESHSRFPLLRKTYLEPAATGRAAEKLEARPRGDDAHGLSVVPRASSSSARRRSTCSWRSSSRRSAAALNERWS